MENSTSPHLAQPYRLPRHIIPTRYDLQLTPHLAQATFDGTVVIAANVLAQAPEIVLNAMASMPTSRYTAKLSVSSSPQVQQ
jgi:puromycin-sensitive aminopeptidase